MVAIVLSVALEVAVAAAFPFPSFLFVDRAVAVIDSARPPLPRPAHTQAHKLPPQALVIHSAPRLLVYCRPLASRRHSFLRSRAPSLHSTDCSTTTCHRRSSCAIASYSYSHSPKAELSAAPPWPPPRRTARSLCAAMCATSWNPPHHPPRARFRLHRLSTRHPHLFLLYLVALSSPWEAGSPPATAAWWRRRAQPHHQPLLPSFLPSLSCVRISASPRLSE